MSNCKKYRKTKDPKCNDQEGCHWVVKKGCLDNIVEAKKPTPNKEFINNKTRATVFLVDIPDSSLDYPDFPDEAVYVDDKDNNTKSCYYPEWIYDNKKRTNHIKCKSDEEYYKLRHEYYKAQDEAENKHFTLITKDIVSIIVENGGIRGDLVENVNEHGYRTEGLYILDNNSSGDLIISRLGRESDSYGNVPSTFSLNEQYNPGYWTNALTPFNDDVINLSDLETSSESYWHSGDEQPEPLNISNLKGLKTKHVHFDEEKGTIRIDLSFMTLIYEGPLNANELLKKLNPKNIDVDFFGGGSENTIYVYPLDENTAELRTY